MSVERAVSPASPAARLLRTIACGGAAVLLSFVPACGSSRADSFTLHSADATTGRGVAEVRLARCGMEFCESLWAGPSATEVSQLAMLPKGQHCDEIAWPADGRRVGFLVDGYQLRMYDAENGKPAGQINLVDPDGPPTSRIARGVTFSQNGAAITFDDCPRTHSGCRAGMVALK